MPSISSRPASPTPATPADVAQQTATQEQADIRRPASRQSQSSEHIPLSRRGSTDGAEGASSTRAPLRVAVSTREGASSSTPKAPSRRLSTEEIVEQSTQAARSGLLQELGIDDSELEQLHAPESEFSKALTQVEPERSKAAEQALALSPQERMQQASAIVHALVDELGEDESAVVKPEDKQRASLEIATYIETGAMTETALAGPSTVAKTGTSAVGMETESDPMRRLSDTLQRTSQEILPDPLNATREQRDAAVTLVLSRELGLPGSAQMVDAARAIAQHERAIATTGTADTQGTLAAIGKAFKNGMSKLTANEFTNPWATLGASAGNVAIRNAGSVFFPTFGRQMLSALIERGFAEMHVSPTGRAFAGASFAALPMGMLAVGAYRAHKNPDATPQQKWQGDVARLIMGAMAFSALLGGIFGSQFKDETSGAAAQMIAFTLYTLMRDIVVQSHVRLKNSNMEHREPGAKPVPDLLHWALISVIYGLDQMGVNQLMPMAAPISGPGAYHAGMGVLDQAKGAFARAGINWGGEIIEDMSFNGIAAVRDGKMLRLGLGWEPNGRHVANGFSAPMAVRTAITQTNVVFGDVIDKALGNKWPLGTNLLPAITMGGLLNGIFYWPFANAGGGLPQVKAPGHEDVQQTVLPNVDLTDSRSVLGTEHHSDEAGTIALRTRTPDVEEGQIRSRHAEPQELEDE